MQQPIGSGFGRHTPASEVMEGVDLSGKRVVVTGGYSGIGVETTRALAAAGAKVFVPARNLAKARVVMDLEGDSRGLGLGMKAGIEAAFRSRSVQGRRLELVALNDSYSPPKTVEATGELIRDGVFAMIGNVGTPTAKVSLPSRN